MPTTFHKRMGPPPEPRYLDHGKVTGAGSGRKTYWTKTGGELPVMSEGAGSQPITC